MFGDARGLNMQEPQILTDQTQLARNRARAQKDAMFLHEEAAQEVQDRLEEVNRTFTDVAVVTDFPDVWSRFFPQARMVSAADTLALDTNAHDLVIHGLALHWANDPVGQMIQSRRALRPDGLFLGVLFGGQTLSQLRAALSEAEVAVRGGLSPHIVPMGEIRDLGALLQRAGFALPVADSSLRTVSYRDAFALMHDLRAMGEGNALHHRQKQPGSRQVFNLAAQYYARHFGTDDGRIPASFELIFLTGWAPDESQQKPLRPGSAAARLADALGTGETRLPD